MTVQKHTHKLRRHTYKSGASVFFCSLPDCTFKVDSALAIGKRTLCNQCSDEMVMDEYQIKLVKPHCKNCAKIKVRGEDGRNRFIRKPKKDFEVQIQEMTNEEKADKELDSLRNRLNPAAVVDLTQEDI